MKLLFFDARVWRYTISAIGKIIEEGVFVVNQEGLRLRAMDPSHVVLIDFYVPSTAFDVFEVEKEEQIGVNFEDIAKIMRRAVKDDQLELSTSGSKLSISFIGKSTRKFVLPQLSLTAEELPDIEAKLQFKAQARMLSDTFNDIVKDLEPVGKDVVFEASSNALKIAVKGDIAEAEIMMDMERGSLLDLNVEEESRAGYSLDYFVDMAGASKAADTITLAFATDMPCKVEFEMPQGARLRFYVAPRVE